MVCPSSQLQPFSTYWKQLWSCQQLRRRLQQNHPLQRQAYAAFIVFLITSSWRDCWRSLRWICLTGSMVMWMKTGAQEAFPWIWVRTLWWQCWGQMWGCCTVSLCTWTGMRIRWYAVTNCSTWCSDAGNMLSTTAGTFLTFSWWRHSRWWPVALLV